MEATEKKSLEKKNIFLLIIEGTPKPVVYSLLVVIITGACTFSFAFANQTDKTNKEFPIVQKKVTEINNKVDGLAIDSEITKTDMSNVKQSVIDVKDELKSQREILLQILYRTNQTYNNTK